MLVVCIFSSSTKSWEVLKTELNKKENYQERVGLLVTTPAKP